MNDVLFYVAVDCKKGMPLITMICINGKKYLILFRIVRSFSFALVPYHGIVLFMQNVFDYCIENILSWHLGHVATGTNGVLTFLPQSLLIDGLFFFSFLEKDLSGESSWSEAWALKSWTWVERPVHLS